MTLVNTAHATKARLKALSQSTSGSLFLKDDRNIFLNPAMVNELDNNVNFEWGSTTGNTHTDKYTNGTPTPEGGGLLRTSTFNYAAQVGRVGYSTLSMAAAQAAFFTAGTNLYYPQNAVDFVMGGPAGNLKWGAGLHYAHSEDKTSGNVNYPRKNARDLSVSGGVLAGQLSGYARLDALAESTIDGATTTIAYNGKVGGELGGKFDIDNIQSVGLALGQTSYHYDDTNARVGDVQGRAIRADYFRLLPVKEGTMAFVTAGLSYTTLDISYPTVGTPSTTGSVLTTPVVLGLEHKALSWLDLRASVSQSVLLSREKTGNGSTDVEKLNTEDTKVAAGFSAHAGDIKIDATFSGVSTGVLNASALGADVAFLYHF